MSDINIDTPEMIDVLPSEYYDYSEAKLLGVIAHLVKNTRTLANTLDTSRPDVAGSFDQILDGVKEPNIEFNVKEINEAGSVGNVNVYMNRITGKFIISDKTTGDMLSSAKPMNNETAHKKMIAHLNKVG